MAHNEIPYSPGQVLRKPADWKNLRFYQKTDTLFQLTFVFCERFLPKYGDRTVDQMIQAARSGKQNIIEGSEDGKTSTEMELKLLNVARSSISELKEDYRDHINKHGLAYWTQADSRFQPMQDYTKIHNVPEDYLTFAQRWNEEEFCNFCLTLCCQVDAMMNSYLKELERLFITEGGIKERMHKARTGYRQGIDDLLKGLQSELAIVKDENARLKSEVNTLTQQLSEWKAKYADIKERALKAYYEKEEEIKLLQEQLSRAGLL